VFKKFIKSFFTKGNVILFELDDWYDWYKEPQKFHNAVVAHLENEGRKVKTISIVKNVTSNKISTLYIDEVKYELSVRIYEGMGPTQTIVLEKLEE
jgi:hypothetical protein